MCKARKQFRFRCRGRQRHRNDGNFGDPDNRARRCGTRRKKNVDRPRGELRKHGVAAIDVTVRTTRIDDDRASLNVPEIEKSPAERLKRALIDRR
jgi:hypothetical protein